MIHFDVVTDVTLGKLNHHYFGWVEGAQGFAFISGLLVAGPESALPGVARLAALVQFIFTRRALVFLGQHSLHVFSYHILLYYLLAATLEQQQLSEAARTAILLLSVVSLYIPAWLHGKSQERSKKAKRQMPAPENIPAPRAAAETRESLPG